MVYVPFAILVILLLAGMVTVSLGWKKWHPATIVAAWLLLLATGGFIVLASMRAQRDAAWTDLVRRYEASTLKLESAQTRGEDGFYRPVGEPSIDSLASCPLDTLVRSRNAWRRTLMLVDSWKGRSWRNATFSPPDGENPGLIGIDMVENPDITAGAVLYVFDQAPEGFDGAVDEAEGGFVGAFRVEKVEGKEVSIRPLADDPDNPFVATDRERWNQPHDLVTVYESLPVDRRVVGTRVERVLEPSLDLSTGRPVTGTMQAEEEDGDDEQAAPERPDSDTQPRDVRWAVVTFEEDYVWKPDDGPEVPFKANDEALEFPAAEVARLKAAGVKFRHRWVLPPGVYWANVTLKQAWRPADDVGPTDADGNVTDYPADTRIAIPLDMAWDLESKNVLSIDDTFRRRPLVDGGGAVEGIPAISFTPTTVSAEAQPQQNARSLPADAEGLNRIAVSINRDIIRLQQTRTTLLEADEIAKKDVNEKQMLRSTIEKDLQEWKEETQQADAMEQALQRRDGEAEGRLRQVTAEIATISEAYRTLTQRVAEEIVRRRSSP